VRDVPERQLWCAVLDRALSDATDRIGTIGNIAERDRLRAEARSWFDADGHDFRRACEGAGLDPGEVRRRALRLIAETV
jgi:hypothetical protein